MIYYLYSDEQTEYDYRRERGNVMISAGEQKQLETELNSLDSGTRRNTLQELAELCRSRRIKIEPESGANNLHCHTFYSYNGYGFSPAFIAYLAKKSGWFAAGTVDFDVLDAVDEFKDAAELFDVRYASGMESRTFIAELADKEINSPGEPGIAYHLGLGFCGSEVPASEQPFAARLRRQAAERTRRIVDVVNAYLAPVQLDYEADVLRLTPRGNATERHVCQAYREKAETLFPDPATRAAFWSGKLKLSPEEAAKLLDNPVALEGSIRSKTMKKGGPGYIVPTPESFPPVEEMNEFTLHCGAIPTIAWLNGLSAGESDPETLLKLHISKGAAMLNIVPDRNWNVSDPEKQRRLVAELNRIIAACDKFDLPIVVGTEMNAPGLKLVDDFGCAALAPHLERFVSGAAILTAHTLLAPLGRGYLSDWARNHFATTAAKNAFFNQFGRLMTPARFRAATVWPEAPDEMLNRADALACRAIPANPERGTIR